MEVLRQRLKPRSRVLAAQDIFHTAQAAREAGPALGRTIQLAYEWDAVRNKRDFPPQPVTGRTSAKTLAVSGTQSYTQICFAQRKSKRGRVNCKSGSRT